MAKSKQNSKTISNSNINKNKNNNNNNNNNNKNNKKKDNFIIKALFSGYYVTAKGREGLKTYEYHGQDLSLIANYIMQPIWRRLVNLLPVWMAPNLVTLLGFGFIIASYLVVGFESNWALEGELKSWVCYFSAFCLFMYQTLDALDGKQARRTSSSSPLGELFDHGCDAVTTILQLLTLGTIIQLGPSLKLYILVIIGMFTFFIKQWEEYFTNTMMLGYANVTEAQFLGITVYLISAVKGNLFWVLNTLTIGNYTLTYSEILFLIAFTGSAITSIDSLIRAIFKAGSRLVEALIYTIPMFAFISLHILWYLNNPNILVLHPHEFMLTIGFLTCNLVGRIVLSRVCKMKFSLIQPLVLVVLFGFLNSLPNTYHYIDTEKYIKYSWMVGMFAYLHFALSVIHDICDALNIRCLRIKPKLI
eukprot:TRINITY_DN4597_c1_g1_i1.p1 TRINITY_DN4597_c1_g1~~TRINITY_DN4597_c1_g1_i1.p1  ORF type:complete len:418 (+),score=138.46 TRINITY_DN4597_c1_g1_i1:89-1342(+)